MNKIKKILRRSAENKLKDYEDPYFLAQLTGNEEKPGEARTKVWTVLPVVFIIIVTVVLSCLVVFHVNDQYKEDIFYGESGIGVLGITSVENMNNELLYVRMTDTYLTSLLWKYNKDNGKSLYYSAQYESEGNNAAYQSMLINILINKNYELFVYDSEVYDTVREYGGVQLKYHTTIEQFDDNYDVISVGGVILTDKEKLSIEYQAYVEAGSDSPFYSMLDEILSVK